jgi:hypothetical protein
MSERFDSKGDPLVRRQSDPGYRIGWRHKVRFEKGHEEGEMTYGEAEKRAEELAAQHPDKVFYPELIFTEQAH